MARCVWLFAVSTAVACSALSGEPVKEVRRSLPLSAGGRLVIETERGSIRVEGWENLQAEISARIEDESYFLRDAEAVRETGIRIDASPDSIRVKSDYSRLRERGWGLLGLLHFAVERPAVHYRIRMPRTARLKIKDYRSETEISNLKSDLELETHRGTVDVRGLDGAIEFKSYRGRALVKMVNLERNCRLETYRGEITLSLPRDRGFQLESDLGRHAALSSDFQIPTQNVSRYHKQYRGAVNGGGPSLRLKSERGSLRLRRS
jgi:hypothetical protein